MNARKPPQEAREAASRLRRFLRAKWESGQYDLFMGRPPRTRLSDSSGRTAAKPGAARPASAYPGSSGSPQGVAPQRPAQSPPALPGSSGAPQGAAPQRPAQSSPQTSAHASAHPESAQPSIARAVARHASGLISPESSEKGRALLAFHERVKSCTQCPLGESRKHFVFGMGNPEAELVMAGEAPGEQEDLKGLPFVGRAGLLLDRVLGKLGMSRDDAFIANVLKCRPPGNRQPAEEEIAACEPYLAEQIRIISPKVIVALGAYAAQTLLKTRKPIGQLRGRTYPVGSALLIATYHPAAILRNPSNEPILEGDLKRARELLAKPRGNPS